MRRLLAVPALLLGSACSENTTLPPADTVAPAFSVSHEQNATNQTTTTIGGVVTDSVGVARLVYRLNGGAEQAVSITPGTSVTFTATVAISAPVTAVEFAAFDAAGNRAVETLEVRYDTQEPTLSVSGLVEGGSFSSFLRLNGAASDPAGTGIRRVTYSVNGGPETNIAGGYKTAGSGDYTFSADAYGLPLGANNFVVSAYDRAGNRTQRRATMTRKE